MTDRYQGQGPERPLDDNCEFDYTQDNLEGNMDVQYRAGMMHAADMCAQRGKALRIEAKKEQDYHDRHAAMYEAIAVTSMAIEILSALEFEKDAA